MSMKTNPENDFFKNFINTSNWHKIKYPHKIRFERIFFLKSIYSELKLMTPHEEDRSWFSVGQRHWSYS